MSQETKAWFEHKFVEWRSKQGKKATITAFAAFLGVSRNTLNNWMLKGQDPDPESIYKIAPRLGDDTYAFFGVTPPDPYLKTIIDNWSKVTDALKQQFSEEFLRVAERGSQADRYRVEKPKRK